jgi:hypothetical protein
LTRPTTVITRAEITAAIDSGVPRADTAELPDPLRWVDLREHPDAAVDVIRRRVGDRRSPARAQTFRWPKEAGGWRPMVWLDPLDQVLYHALVGRFVSPVEARLDRGRVLSARPIRIGRGWGLENHGKAIGERRDRAITLLDSQPSGTLGLIDIRQYFPSIGVDVVGAVLSRLPVPDLTCAYLKTWLAYLAEHSRVRGLPIGLAGSSILGNLVLVSADDYLSRCGAEFMRYMDDTWLFLERDGPYEEIMTGYRECCGQLGLELHPEKTRAVTGFDRYEVVSSLAIDYLADELGAPGDRGRTAARALFEEAIEAPIEHRRELRRALTELTRHRDLFALDHLQLDHTLLRPAIRHWVRYLGGMLEAKRTRRKLDPDWLLEEATTTTERDEAYRPHAFLRVLQHPRCRLNKQRGKQLLAVASTQDGWRSPMRVLAGSAWGRSDAWREELAIERVEQLGDYSTRRAFAATLHGRLRDRRIRLCAMKLRLADPDLEPVARWIEA